MRTIILDGKMMRDREETHDYLKAKFHLPDYYGRNLDALWDLLSYERTPTKVIFINLFSIYENLGDYGNDLIEVFSEIDQEEGNIEVEFDY